jgi:hypothetical protein
MLWLLRSDFYNLVHSFTFFIPETYKLVQRSALQDVFFYNAKYLDKLGTVNPLCDREEYRQSMWLCFHWEEKDWISQVLWLPATNCVPTNVECKADRFTGWTFSATSWETRQTWVWAWVKIVCTANIYGNWPLTFLSPLFWLLCFIDVWQVFITYQNFPTAVISSLVMAVG